MKTKKTIVWAMAAAGLLLLAAGALGVVDLSYRDHRERARRADWRQHCNQATGEFQKLLNETAARIRRLPVDPAVASALSTEIARRSPLTRLQVWFSDLQGGFVFGEPYTAFRRLNAWFDRYGQGLVSSGAVSDRNDFLLRTADRLDDLEEGRTPPPDKGISVEEFMDRFRRDSRWLDDDYSGPLELSLSAQALDGSGQPLGTLFAKVVDRSFEADLNDRQNSVNRLLFESSGVLSAVAVLVLWLLLPSWVYLDARQRGLRSPLRWALLTALSVGFAWLLYLLVRPQSPEATACPKCGGELNGTRAFCPHCGHDLSSSFCPQCQYPIQAEWKFCPSCRHPLGRQPEKKESDPEPTA